MVKGLALEGVTVHYGALRAVHDFSLLVSPSEVVALLGASGSGKSSVLRAVAGLEPLTAGRISWDGTDLANTPVHKRGIGLMFQDGQLFPHRSVAGNVRYGLRHLPAADRKTRVTDMLQLVGLAELADRPIHTLSGGQAQRVALARALAPSPKVLLLDEPLSALDRSLRGQLARSLTHGLRATGTTALMVTHDPAEAFAMADRVAVMADGELIAVGPPQQVRAMTDPRVRSILD